MRYRLMRFPGGKAKAVTFSYDDGCDDDARLAQLLTKYNLKGTFNLNSRAMLDLWRLKEWGLTKEQVQELILDKGHEVAVHGYLHRAEGVLRPIEGIRDVLDCRLELEERYGIIIRGMAYPDTGIRLLSNSATYEKIKAYLKDLDIVYSRTLGGDNNSFDMPEDWHRWMPTAHHNNEHIMEYIDEFNTLDLSTKRHAPRRVPKLFYLWGHSYELTNDNNWDHMEKICEKLSGKEDVWYATNIEIYNYAKAYDSLIYSADSTIVYNPTLYDIWFDVDGTLYCIKPGETIKIQ